MGDFIAWGYNHFPAYLEVTEKNLADRNWKLKHIIHAEVAAILAAARNGSRTNGTAMYMPWVPCTPCALVIADAGIKALYTHEPFVQMTPEDWREDTMHALDVLRDCHVQLYMVTGKIGDTKAMFRGKEWEP